MKLKISIFALGLFLFCSSASAQSPCTAILDAGVTTIANTLSAGVERINAVTAELSDEKTQAAVLAAAEDASKDAPTPEERRAAIAAVVDAHKAKIETAKATAKAEVATLRAELANLSTQLKADVRGCLEN